MKYLIIALGAVALLGGGAYAYLHTLDPMSEPAENTGVHTYSNTQLGLEFQYPNGYVIQEHGSSDEKGDGLKTIVVARAHDLEAVPVGGEAPPTITIQVFRNAKNQFSRTWADDHTQYSNINLLRGEVYDVVIGGANGIRYTADGLYASNNIVVAHGGNSYVFTGMYLDQDSDLYRDFDPLIKSVKFIATSDQVQGTTPDVPKQVTMTGRWECLPHKEKGGVQTMECAFGIIKDQSDAHFGIDTQFMSAGPVDFAVGTHVQVTGLLTPAQMLSSKSIYDIDGIISATAIKKI